MDIPQTTMELRQWRRKGETGVVGLAYDDKRNVYHDGMEFVLAGTYKWLEDELHYYVQGPLRNYYKLAKAEEQKE